MGKKKNKGLGDIAVSAANGGMMYPDEPAPDFSEEPDDAPPAFSGPEMSEHKMTFKEGMLYKRGGGADNIDNDGKKGAKARLGKKVDVRQRKQEQWFVYKDRVLDWWDSRKDAQKGKKLRRGR